RGSLRSRASGLCPSDCPTPSLARGLVRRGSVAQAPGLLRLFVRCVLAAEAAVLAHFEPLGRLLLVLGRAVVATLTVLTRQGDDVSHCCLARFARSLSSVRP